MNLTFPVYTVSRFLDLHSLPCQNPSRGYDSVSGVFIQWTRKIAPPLIFLPNISYVLRFGHVMLLLIFWDSLVTITTAALENILIQQQSVEHICHHYQHNLSVPPVHHF